MLTRGSAVPVALPSLAGRANQVDVIVARLTSAGLAVEDVTIRYPYPEVEYPSRRAYILARR